MFSDALCYDTETSDADFTHGQVLEFGAVHLHPKTLTETSTTEIDVRLLPYVVPAPEAMTVCGYEPAELCDPARLDETEAARRIARVLKPGFQPKLQATWNGLKFDSQILRTTMWRNLLDPWVTSGAKVRQLDVMILSQMAHFVDPAILSRGRKADGTPSWRLQDVAPANGIELKAHRAVNDARATAAIMRMVAARRRALFDFAVRRGDDDYVGRIASPAAGEVLFLFTSFGEPRFEPILPLSVVRGQTVAARLDEDHAALTDGDDAAVGATLFTAGGPCCAFKPKASPMVFTAAEAASLGLPVGDLDALSAKAKALRASRAAETARRVQESAVFDPPADTPEARIYEKFASTLDKDRADSFHAASSNVARIQIAQNISDIRMREMAARMLLVHSGATPAQFAEALGAERGAALERLGRRALTRPHAGEDAAWMTVGKARSGGDAAFAAWLDERYGAPSTAPATEEPRSRPAAAASAQMTFGF